MSTIGPSDDPPREPDPTAEAGDAASPEEADQDPPADPADPADPVETAETAETAPPPGPDLGALPTGFVWGAATSAPQIEGGAEERGRSIWDTYCREPGRIKDGSDASVACDHYHRYAEDVALLRGLGVDAYRFSLSWPRLQPQGKGPLEAAGLSFYDRLLDELLAAGLDPWATIYHWDLPQPLQNVGGWPVREVADRFADFAVAVHAALGDRVRSWMTLNEPWCSAWLGYGAGRHAPGATDIGLAARAAHHLLVAHGQAMLGMRQQAPADHSFGIVLNPGSYRPDDGLSVDQVAVVRPAAAILDGIHTRWWLDGLLLGSYPQDVLDLLAEPLDGVVLDGDPALISQPLDYLGVNYYSDVLLRPRFEGLAAGRPEPELPGTEAVSVVVGGPGSTTMGWPVTPDGLRALLLRIATEYPAVPLVITENGSAWHDSRSTLQVREDVPPAPIPDPARVAYLEAHLAALAAAAAQGVDIRGYFAWSLMDNFEWSHGYTQRFGLVRVDFDTLERRPRASYETYRALIASQRS